MIRNLATPYIPQKSLPIIADKLQSRRAANEVTLTPPINIAAPVPVSPTSDGVRGVKTMIVANQKTLLDPRVALSIKELEPTPEPSESDDSTPTAATMPVKAPPGGIWTPYDNGGGFVITMGADGRAICGPGPSPSGPFYVPTPTEEM